MISYRHKQVARRARQEAIGRQLLGNGAEADRQPVPAVDGNDGQRQVDQFFVGKLLANCLIHLIWHVVNGNQGHGLRPGQGGPLSLGVERGLAPGHQFVQALFGFAARPRGFGMQIDSIRTPIDLGRTNFHEFNEQRLLASEGG